MIESAAELNRTPAAPRKPAAARNVLHLELLLAALLTGAWILFHIQFFLHARGLWRDEVNSVDFSNGPTFSGIWQNLQYDSFPMLWHFVLRAWLRSGITPTDQNIRVLGLIVGLALLATVWLNAIRFRLRPPIVALAMLGFTAAILSDGDSIRAYGLGIVLELLTFGAIWQVATRPSLFSITTALFLSLAAVHALFYNSLMLLAICCGGFAITILHRQWKRAGILLAIGVVCAISTLIYTGYIHRAGKYRVMLLHDSGLTWIATKFMEAAGYDSAVGSNIAVLNAIAWATLITLGIVAGAFALFSPRPADNPGRRDLVIYHLAVLIAALFIYIVFLLRLSYLMQPWYFLALLALAAICCDGLIGSISGPPLRFAVCVLVLAFCCVTAAPVWANASLRKTGIDGDAQNLARTAKKGDLIVISPWYFGITFQRYYDGPAEYVTVPPMSLLAYHDYDLLIPQMQNLHAMDSALDKVTAALRSGHTVYLLGNFAFPSTDKTYPTLDAPAPNNSFGWLDWRYYDLWTRQITYTIARDAEQVTALPVDYNDVSNYERPGLYAARGFKSPARQDSGSP